MADERTRKPEDLIDVSEFENEISDDALTEIAGKEELTPIRERADVSLPKRKKPSPIITGDAFRGKKGTAIATLRERFTAFFIDSIFLFYLYWLYASIYARLFLGAWGAGVPYTGWHGLSLHGSFLLIAFIYYFVMEGIFLVTIGKFICWMSVRKKSFDAASLLATFIRNLLRIVDYILIVPSVFLMEMTSFKQRFGDLIAGTTVIKKFSDSPETYKVLPSGLASASGRTVALFVDLLLFIPFIAGYALILSPEYPFISRWLLLFAPLVIIIYFVLIEMVSETSPGKWLMGYITCQDNGERLKIEGSIVRTIWRLLDTNPAGLLCLFISSSRQRPGDTAAGTVVLKRPRRAKGAASILIAIALAAITLYAGMTNGANFLSPKFKINFLPNISIIEDMGISAPKYDTVIVEHFRFAANEPNNYRVPPTFAAGETVYLVFELNGYKKNDRDVWLQEDLAVKYPDGTIGLKQENIVDYKEVLKGSGPVELTNNITLPLNAVPGTYQILITIRDMIGAKEATEVQNFFVRRNAAEILKDVE